MSSNASAALSFRKWAALGVAIIAILTVPIGIVYLQQKLKARPHDSPRPWEDPAIAKKLSAARLVKAKAIREEWRQWVLKHKEIVGAMLASHGKDFSKLEAVYKITPPLTSGDWRPDTSSGAVKFGWYGDELKWLANGEQFTEQSKLEIEKMKPELLRRSRAKQTKEFAELSDFTVAASSNPGPTTEIWASGRVTEKSWIPNPAPRSGQPAMVQAPYKELMPPFDFLTSSIAD